MPGYLLDTNVLSEVVKKRPSPSVLGRLRGLRSDVLHASSISVMELRYGAARSAAGSQLWERIRKEVLARVTILPLREQEASRAGDILADLEARGSLVGIEDVLIGATALVADLALVTRNVRHFTRIRGLEVENWWE